MRETLLIEIGCEEIPARVIRSAAEDLRRRLLSVLERAGLGTGEAHAWGGARRLGVRVESVPARQPDRKRRILGPSAEVAFDGQGRPTRAAEGFARKVGVEPVALEVFDTPRGRYVGVERTEPGRSLEAWLAQELPLQVAAMSFPKTMRWGDGRKRWVRPVHWLLVLHGRDVLREVRVFDVAAEGHSHGHRFLAPGPVPIPSPERYESALEEAYVIVEPAERRKRLNTALRHAAEAHGGRLLEDPELLEEVADLVEWPGVVAGTFDARFLELPREILITALRHHQKCFCVVDRAGSLLPVFIAVTNTNGDPAGHIRRGNEWVVGGRLEDAAFFWSEDRRVPLASRRAALGGVVFHARAGSYAEKTQRLERLAPALAGRLGLSAEEQQAVREAAGLAKADLVTNLVGEFPELEGVVGGLLLEAEGADPRVARAVYEHTRPRGADDVLPETPLGCVLAVADRLDTLRALVGAGESPTGSRDPFGLRRAAKAVFRIVEERGWPLGLSDLEELAEADDATRSFLRERYVHHERERGFTINEIRAVLRPGSAGEAWTALPLPDLLARLEAVRRVRGRRDFEELVDLTKRVENILVKGASLVAEASSAASAGFREREGAAQALEAALAQAREAMNGAVARRAYGEVVEILAGFVEPVERFFAEVLVLDPEHPEATVSRTKLLERLRDLLTECFDVRELAGAAGPSEQEEQ